MATTQAEVRVSDAWDASPTDASDTTFTVSVSAYAATPATLDLGNVDVTMSTSGVFTIDDPGTGALGVASITSDNPRFTPGRSSMTVGAGGSDTLSVTFSPTTTGADSALLTLVADDPASPHTLRVRANAGHFLAVGDGRPAAFALAQNAPNPSAGRTLVRFDVPRRAHVTLDVLDVTGRVVATLVDEEREPGTHAVTFGANGTADARGSRGGPVGAGVYFLRLRAPGFSAVRRMAVMR